MVRSVSVNDVSRVAHGIGSGPLLFILYTSELFHIARKNIVGYADTAVFAVIPTKLLRPEVMESLHQPLAAINF